MSKAPTKTEANIFRDIYQERIDYHKYRNTIYLDDFMDIMKGLRRWASGSMFGKPPKLKYPLLQADTLNNVEFVFLHVFLAKYYLNTHYVTIKNYCKRMGFYYFIPSIYDTDSSHKNAPYIYKQLKERFEQNNGKKFVLIGMSKGVIDGMEAIIHSADSIKFAEKNILAIISIGGSIGGSHLADFLHEKIGKFLLPIGLIKTGFPHGIDSMRTKVRKIQNEYFKQYCPSSIKSFSISFVSYDHSKSILSMPVKFLSQYDKKNDGFVLVKHTKIPNSVDLGNYEGDHSMLVPFFNRHHLELFEAIVIYLRLKKVI